MHTHRHMYTHIRHSHTHVYKHAYTQAHAYTHMYTHISTLTGTCIHTHMYTHISTLTATGTRIHTYASAHIHTDTCTHTHAHTHRRMYTHTHVYTHKHTHSHKHMHTHTHAYTHKRVHRHIDTDWQTQWIHANTWKIERGYFAYWSLLVAISLFNWFSITLNYWMTIAKALEVIGHWWRGDLACEKSSLEKNNNETYSQYPTANCIIKITHNTARSLREECGVFHKAGLLS